MSDLSKLELWTVVISGVVAGLYFDDWILGMLVAASVAVGMAVAIVWIKNFNGGDFN